MSLSVSLCLSLSLSVSLSLSLCLSLRLSSSTQLLPAGVAINNAGVSAASTNLSVVHLSFIYRFSWEFWFLVLLTFLLVFFMFVGLICKTICRLVPTRKMINYQLLYYFIVRARQVEQNKKEETNTEVLFQYSENFLR